MQRLTAVVVLTAAFAPAAVLGALPLVIAVVLALTAVVLAAAALAPRPAPVLVSEPVERAGS